MVVRSRYRSAGELSRSLLACTAIVGAMSFAGVSPGYAVDDPLGTGGGSSSSSSSSSTPQPSVSSTPSVEESKDTRSSEEYLNDVLNEMESSESPAPAESASPSEAVMPWDKPDSGTYSEELPTPNDAPRSSTQETVYGFKPGLTIDVESTFARIALFVFGKVISAVVLLTFLAYMLVTALDLLFIALPPAARVYMHDFNEGGMGQDLSPTSPTDRARKRARLGNLVSNSAYSVVVELGGGAQAQQVADPYGGGSMGGMMGGFNGAMGGSGMGMPSTTNVEPASRRTMYITYLKERFWEGIFLGVCFVLLLTGNIVGYGMDAGTMLLEGIVMAINWVGDMF